jgi:hypothetical protein
MGKGMKKITKKISTIKGATLTARDIHSFLEEVECHFDDDYWTIYDGQKMTVKVKGKIIDSEDLTISFEEE